MGDYCIHIVPVHRGNYPDAERKAGEILKWFQDRDMVEDHPSDCTLSATELSHRFKPAITSIFEDAAKEEQNLSLRTFGLELHHGERQVFHPMRGRDLTLTCPACGHAHDLKAANPFLNAWFRSENDCPKYLGCGKAEHIAYGFAEMGFTDLQIDAFFEAASKL